MVTTSARQRFLELRRMEQSGRNASGMTTRPRVPPEPARSGVWRMNVYEDGLNLMEGHHHGNQGTLYWNPPLAPSTNPSTTAGSRIAHMDNERSRLYEYYARTPASPSSAPLAETAGPSVQNVVTGSRFLSMTDYGLYLTDDETEEETDEDDDEVVVAAAQVKAEEQGTSNPNANGQNDLKEKSAAGSSKAEENVSNQEAEEEELPPTFRWVHIDIV